MNYYRIGKTRTDLLLPGTHDYWVVQRWSQEHRVWLSVMRHPSQTTYYRKTKVNVAIEPFPMRQLAEAKQMLKEIQQHEASR